MSRLSPVVVVMAAAGFLHGPLLRLALLGAGLRAVLALVGQVGRGVRGFCWKCGGLGYVRFRVLFSLCARAQTTARRALRGIERTREGRPGPEAQTKTLPRKTWGTGGRFFPPCC